MANEVIGVVTYTRKIVLFAFRVSYRFASTHPFLLCAVLFLIVLYRLFPCLFAFFVSSSPILICTTVLLGILLSYGEPNQTESGEKKVVSRITNKDGKGEQQPAGERADKESTSKEIQAGEKIAEDGEVPSRGIVEKKEKDVLLEKRAEGKKTTGDQKKGKGLKVDIDKSGLENRFEDSGDAYSNSSSDESLSQDDSITDVIPVLDEHHPLLDASAPQPAFKSVDNSDVASGEENESDDGSTIEEDNQDDDEDEDAQKDDGNEKVVKWTEDDQKNLMDLGTSEMERNMRLENLIAKRIARKSIIPEIVSNLIDLDVPVPTVEDPSRFHVQIPPRRNPFDVPYDPGEAMGLPPIPGSAPSILLPRRNPFDLPFDQVDQGSGLAAAGPSQPVFVPIPQRDPFFRRHESFSMGATLPGAFKEDKRDSHFKPYFVPQKIEETGFPTLERQLSDKSVTKLSSVAETDESSSIADGEHPKELLEEGFHHESEILSHTGHDAGPDEQESHSSEEVDSVETDSEQSERSTRIVHGNGLSNTNVTEEIHQANDAGHIPDVANAKLEVIEDKYDDSRSSSSSDMNEKHSNSSIHCGSINSESKVSNDATQLPSKPDDGQVPDPVYDSSPSAAEKLLAEDLFNSGSPPRPVEKTISPRVAFGPTNEDLAFSSGGLWVAAPSLSSVDEIESRSRGISEIKERDVIQVALPVPREDFVRPIALVMPRTVSGRIIHPSSLSSMDVESSEDSS